MRAHVRIILSRWFITGRSSGCLRKYGNYNCARLMMAPLPRALSLFSLPPSLLSISHTTPLSLLYFLCRYNALCRLSRATWRLRASRNSPREIVSYTWRYLILLVVIVSLHFRLSLFVFGIRSIVFDRWLLYKGKKRKEKERIIFHFAMMIEEIINLERRFY